MVGPVHKGPPLHRGVLPFDKKTTVTVRLCHDELQADPSSVPFHCKVQEEELAVCCTIAKCWGLLCAPRLCPTNIRGCWWQRCSPGLVFSKGDQPRERVWSLPCLTVWTPPVGGVSMPEELEQTVQLTFCGAWGTETCGCICIKLYSARHTELYMSAWGTLGLKSAAETQRLDPTGQIVYFCHPLLCSPTPNRSRGFCFFLQIDFTFILYSITVTTLSFLLILS